MSTPRTAWLKLDAQNRALRSLLQAAAVSVFMAVVDTVIQAVQIWAGGASWDWHELGDTTAKTAVMAGLLPVAAYLHRLRVDPSLLPSAEPPPPPIVDRSQ